MIKNSRDVQEIKVNHERWLVSYADFMTLLFGFFLVMYSVSQINEEKYRELKGSLATVFTEKPSFASDLNILAIPSASNQTQLMSNKTASQSAITPDSPLLAPSHLKSVESAPSSPQAQTSSAEATPIESNQTESLQQQLTDSNLGEIAKITATEHWVQIDLDSDVLFTSGSAEPSPQAIHIFSKIADQLKASNTEIKVAGHTDNVPINTPIFPSNWELSSARATSIVRVLIDMGLAPQRMSAVGYGEYRPVADNQIQTGREANRRVVLTIAKHPMPL